MAAYTLTIEIDPPLTFHISAHDDAGAITMARTFCCRELREADQAMLAARVTLTDSKDVIVFEGTVAKVLGNRATRDGALDR